MQKYKLLLTLFFVVVFFKQIVWIALIPMWQTPDEQAHFAQVQNIVEKNILFPDAPTTSREIEIAENYLGTKRNLNGNNNFTYSPKFNIIYTNSTTGKFEQKINSINILERKNLVIKEASGYPPLYYQLSALGYRLVYSTGLINRVFFIRIFQSLIYVLTIFIYFTAAKEIIHKKEKALLFAIFIAFLPMPSFVAAGITSDNLMNLLFASGIYMGILIIEHGIKIKYLLAFGIIAIMGGLTKPHFIIAIPIVWFSVLLSSLKERSFKKFAFLNLMCLFALPFLLWIFYPSYFHDFLATKNVFLLLPEIGNLSNVTRGKESSVLSYLTISIQKTYRETIPWFWGVFRWLSLTLDRWYYRVWNLVAAISLIYGIIHFRKKIKLSVVFLVFSTLIYFIILFFWDYLFFLGHGFSFGIQGRYYFPILFSVAFLIYYFFPVKKILVAISFFFNFYALFKISASYYNITSVSSFIIQASQYKPWFFKGNYLILIICAYVILLLLFLIKLLALSSRREGEERKSK